MSRDEGSKAWRFIVATLLAMGTLGFGLASLCGAAFTVMTIPDMFSSRVENYSAAFLVISVPSLLIGGGLAWWCVRALRRRLRDGNA